jgi:hypothetical protein
MSSTIRRLSAIAAIAATSSAMAETPQDKELRACLTAAYTKHLQAKTHFFQALAKAGYPNSLSTSICHSVGSTRHIAWSTRVAPWPSQNPPLSVLA